MEDDGFDWDDFLQGDKPDWGIFPLPVCACGEMTERDCQQDCISDSVVCYDYQNLDKQFDQLLVSFGVELSDERDTFSAGNPTHLLRQRPGSIDEFEGQNFYVAKTVQIEETGEFHDRFPDLDLPDWHKQTLIDSYYHPDDDSIYVEVYEWPDGQIRRLMREYK